MIVTVGNTKGGVGKTMLSLNISIELARAGRDVWLIDGDRQGTAQSAVARRAEAGKKPHLACASYCDGAQLRSQVIQQRARFEEIVIDVGGRDSSALRAALVVTDILLIPFQPRSFDVWSLSDISSLVREAQAMRDGLRAFAVLNCSDSAGMDNRDAAAAVADHPELTYIDAPLGRRKAFSNAAGCGFGVSELKQPDPKAHAELTRLMKLLYVTDERGHIGEQSVMFGESTGRYR